MRVDQVSAGNFLVIFCTQIFSHTIKFDYPRQAGRQQEAHLHDKEDVKRRNNIYMDTSTIFFRLVLGPNKSGRLREVQAHMRTTCIVLRDAFVVVSCIELQDRYT